MLRSFLIYLPSVALARGGAFLVTFAATHALAPAAFGYFALVMLIGEFADQSAANWIRVALARFGAGEAGVSRGFALAMARVLAACAVVAVAGTAAIAGWLAPERAGTVALAAGAYVGATTLTRFGLTLVQTTGAAGRASLLETLRALAVLVGSVAGFRLSGEFLLPSLLASLGTAAVGLAALAVGLAATDPRLPRTVPLRRIAAYAAPLVALTVLSQVIAGLDKAMLKSLGDAAGLGVYVAAFTVGRAGFDILGTAFNQGAFVRLAALWNAGRHREAEGELRRQVALLAAVFLPAVGTLLSARDAVALALFPDAYRDAFHDVIPWVALGAVALNLKYFAFDAVFHMHERNLRQLPALVAGAGTSAAIGWAFAGADPAWTAARMFAGGALAALAVTVVLSRRLAPVALPGRAIVVAAVLGLAVEAVGMVLRNHLFDDLPALAVVALIGAVGVLACAASLAVALLLEAPDRRGVALALVSTDPDRITGITSYAAGLFPAIAAAAGRPVTVYTNVDPALLPGLDAARIVRLPGKPRGLPFKLYEPLVHQGAVIAARLAGARSYLSATPVGAPLPVIDQIVTIHDFYDFDRTQRPLRSVVYALLAWRWSALVSRAVVCVSDATREEALALMPAFAGRCTVVKEASKFRDDDRDPPAGPPADFLMVANIQPNKNVEGLLDALARAERRGERPMVRWIGSDRGGAIARWAAANRMPAGFVPLGALPDVELRSAIRAAVALVVPSRKEGFCLPVLEAQALGTPVIAADIPILREVAGAGALFVPLDDPDALTAAMARLAGDPALRDRLARAGRANARGYSWSRAAAETLALVDGLDHGRRHGLVVAGRA